MSNRALCVSLILFACSTAAAAAAPDVQKTPAAPSPLPMPYPNVAAVDAAAAAQMAEPASLELKVEGLAWGKLSDATIVHSADPMEGGQIAARTYQPGKPTYGNATIDGVASDPEEGGQVSAAKAAKPKIRDIQVTKVKDVASANLSSARMTPREPGRLEVPNMVAEPLARGTATFKTLAGICATGKHFPKVKITTRTGSYTLDDATVTGVTAAGDGMDEVSLTYASLEN